MGPPFNFTFNDTLAENLWSARVILNLTVGIFTVTVCSLICAIQIKTRQFTTVSNIVLLNAIVADLFAGVGILFFTFVAVHSFEAKPLFDNLCKWTWVLVFFTIGWSAWAVFFVAYDRYEAVARGMRRRMTFKKAIAGVSVTAFGAAAFAVFPPTGWGGFESGLMIIPPGGDRGLCLLHNSGFSHSNGLFIYGILFFSVSSYLPQLLTTISLILLLCTAWKIFRKGGRNEESALLRSRGFRFIIAVILCKLICVIPFQTSLLGKAAQSFVIDESIDDSFEILYSTNFVINSSLYFLWLNSSNGKVNLKCCCRKTAQMNDVEFVSANGRARQAQEFTDLESYSK
ncbi:pinopsin-like isoform X2 [Oscarella lobularis]|uniref:pinopsin-like isoform X2 n=1 Tax=Oscarella lobularis TaxID=121494 RepID=UPI003313E78D